MRPDKPLLANPDIVFREEEDGAFLFHPDTGELKCLNPMGSRIWSLLDGRITLSGIEEEMFSAYPDVPRERVRGDLTTYLEELLEIGYVGHPLE